jgi:hypothetical protein
MAVGLGISQNHNYHAQEPGQGFCLKELASSEHIKECL